MGTNGGGAISTSEPWVVGSAVTEVTEFEDSVAVDTVDNCEDEISVGSSEAEESDDDEIKVELSDSDVVVKADTFAPMFVLLSEWRSY